MSPRRLAAAGLVLAVAAAGCAPRGLELPAGTGEPLADTSAVQTALAHCRDVSGVSAEVGLSGRAGRQRLRGRVLVGVSNESMRLEGVAPFGAPAFILAASPGETTLLLPREDRVLTGAEPSAILEALVGVEATPPQLQAWLAGCPGLGAPVSAEQFGTRWIVARHEGGSMSYLRAERDAWRLAAVERPGVRIEFGEHAGPRALRVRLLDTRAGDRPAFDLALRLAQVEINPGLPPQAFTVSVPPEAVAITLDELRAAGPLRAEDNP